MQRISGKTAGLAVVLTFALAGSVQAQPQHQQHHPGAAQALRQQPGETGQGTAAPPQMMDQMQGMMSGGGMLGHGGMMDRGRSVR